jgi:hypothetical protein
MMEMLSSKHCVGQMPFGQKVFDKKMQNHARQHLTSLKRCVGQMVIDQKTVFIINDSADQHAKVFPLT